MISLLAMRHVHSTSDSNALDTKTHQVYTATDCQIVYQNLLTTLSKACASSDPLMSSAYTRKLWEGQKCDGVKNLSSLRHDMLRFQGQDCTQRIVAPKSNASPADLVANFYTVYHYMTWHRIELRRTLNWSFRIKHHFVESRMGHIKACSEWRNYFPPNIRDDGPVEHRVDQKE